MRPLLFSALLFVGCRTTWPEDATVTSASGQRLCAKHHIPLVTTRAYQAPTHGDKVYLVHNADHPYYHIAEQYCPNHIPEYVAVRPAWILREPTTIAYCPLCEKEFRERLRVPDRKSAVEFAQYVLPIWGGGGLATKPPYEVTLKDDVWTVSCSLVNGRRATIKIGKETGRVLSTQYSYIPPNQSIQQGSHER
jgi:hypothetical protein